MSFRPKATLCQGKYEKENTAKKNGRKKGHHGSRRNTPEYIDRTVVHRADCCPDCGGKLNECSDTRDRLIEDIPETTRIEVVQHVIHRDWCPACCKSVEPVVADALPMASIGNGILVLCAWLHFSLGNTISQILEVFNYHLQFKMSAGGLVQMWQRLSDILYSWYEEIIDDIQNAGVLHGDETGWREVTYQNRRERIEKRLQLLIDHEWANKEARRLIKRLRRHQDQMFTFLGHPEVSFDNNFGERSIRGAVIMRKNSFNNRSERGQNTVRPNEHIFHTQATRSQSGRFREKAWKYISKPETCLN